MVVLNESGPDAGLAWHYGDPMREQRRLVAGEGAVDLSNRGVVSISGPDRLGWLHSLTSQHLSDLQPGGSATALILSPTGHIEQLLYGVDDGATFWAVTEPGRAADLAEWLIRMQFMMRVEVVDRSAEFAAVWSPQRGTSTLDNEGRCSPIVRISMPEGGSIALHPRAEVAAALGEHPAGTWAYDALRIAAGVPRLGLDTDERTIPNEIGLLGTHLDKGCYRGQETVARVHTLGRPPRRLVLLHLDGGAETLPAHGDPINVDGRQVGTVGGAARHYELGPIALALVKRNTPVEATLVATTDHGPLAAAQEALVDPEVGLHVRPRL